MRPDMTSDMVWVAAGSPNCCHEQCVRLRIQLGLFSGLLDVSLVRACCCCVLLLCWMCRSRWSQRSCCCCKQGSAAVDARMLACGSSAAALCWCAAGSCSRLLYVTSHSTLRAQALHGRDSGSRGGGGSTPGAQALTMCLHTQGHGGTVTGTHVKNTRTLAAGVQTGL
jgi:hypothetical protein